MRSCLVLALLLEAALAFFSGPVLSNSQKGSKFWKHTSRKQAKCVVGALGMVLRTTDEAGGSGRKTEIVMNIGREYDSQVIGEYFARNPGERLVFVCFHVERCGAKIPACFDGIFLFFFCHFVRWL